MLNHDVCTLVNQGLGSIAFLARIIPGVGPNDFDLHVRVNRPCAHHEGVDTTDNFRDREGADIANNVRLGHFTGDHTSNITAFIETCGIGRQVVGTLVTGCMFEFDIRELLGNFFGRVHETERGGEDQVVAGLGHLTDHAFSIGTFRHAFDIAGRCTVAEFSFNGLTANVMTIRPAMVTNRADIDKTGLNVFGLGCTHAGCEGTNSRNGGKCALHEACIHSFSLPVRHSIRIYT